MGWLICTLFHRRNYVANPRNTPRGTFSFASVWCTKCDRVWTRDETSI